jgi:pimeloyl-ACP methyl ester carboxylesterase
MMATIVLVHGLWMNGFEMSLLRRRLGRDHAYATRRFSYAGVMHDLEQNAGQLNTFLRQLPAGPVHLVGHSLGGVLIMHTLTRFPNPQIGRVVCLGSPLTDSAAARFVSRVSPGRFIIGQTLRDGALAAPLDSADIAQSVGVIAGTMEVGAGSLLGVLQAPHDGVVEVRETQLPGITDHIELPVSHIGLLVAVSVAEQTAAFIKNGRFNHR